MKVLKHLLSEAEDLVLDTRDAVLENLSSKTISINIGYWKELCEEQSRVADMVNRLHENNHEIARYKKELSEERERLKPLPESQIELELKNSQEIEKLLRNEIEALKEAISMSPRARRAYKDLTGEIIEEAPLEPRL